MRSALWKLIRQCFPRCVTSHSSAVKPTCHLLMHLKALSFYYLLTIKHSCTCQIAIFLNSMLVFKLYLSNIPGLHKWLLQAAKLTTSHYQWSLLISMSGTTHQEVLHWTTNWFPLLGQDDVDQFLLVGKVTGRRERGKDENIINSFVAAAQVIIFTKINCSCSQQRLTW